MASRVRVRRLKSVDFPTFGRPTRAMTGFMKMRHGSRDSAASQPQGEKGPVLRLHQERRRQRADERGRRANRAMRAVEAGDERTGVARQKMHVAFEIADRGGVF